MQVSLPRKAGQQLVARSVPYRILAICPRYRRVGSRMEVITWIVNAASGDQFPEITGDHQQCNRSHQRSPNICWQQHLRQESQTLRTRRSACRLCFSQAMDTMSAARSQAAHSPVKSVSVPLQESSRELSSDARPSRFRSESTTSWGQRKRFTSADIVADIAQTLTCEQRGGCLRTITCG